MSIFIVTEQGAVTLTGETVNLDFQWEGDTYATLRVDDGATESPIAAPEVVRDDGLDTREVKEPSDVWVDKLGSE